MSGRPVWLATYIPTGITFLYDGSGRCYYQTDEFTVKRIGAALLMHDQMSSARELVLLEGYVFIKDRELEKVSGVSERVEEAAAEWVRAREMSAKRRKRKGLTLRAIADRYGVSSNSIRRYLERCASE